MARILALDLGKQKTGLALSDPDQRWAFGRGIVKGSIEDVVKAITDIRTTDEIERVVIGLPLSLQGTGIGEQEQWVREQAEKIRQGVQLPVEFMEERFSSEMGRRLQQEAGKKGDDDEAAAKIILQSYLDQRFRT
ncbi:MAG: Holliday junction resolvase RuvX [Candidatus Nomurabacteria bacterium]|nr:MAG: Holliday junction resolvase RuvX [Candidatus Nomurabacteria bacterium]